MAAIDTVGVFATAGAASPFPTPLAAAPGDSLAIRNFPLSAYAAIEGLFYAAGGNQRIRVQSPNLHDNQTGLTFEPLESPAQFLVPQSQSVYVQANDQLALNGGIAAAGTIAGLLVRGEAPTARALQPYAVAHAAIVRGVGHAAAAAFAGRPRVSVHDHDVGVSSSRRSRKCPRCTASSPLRRP